MTTHTTIRSRSAIALGSLFAIGTCYVLFADVKRLAGFTVDHVMTLLVLTGTIASGHMVWQQARAWRMLPAIGLAVLFMGGTVYCVVTSAGRNSETSGLKQAEITKRNDELADLRSRIDEAREDVRRQKASEEAECKSGEGTKCKGRTKLRTAAESHLAVLEARLELAQPPQQVNASQKHAAKLFAALPLVTASAEHIEGLLDLFVPFFKALFLELATILFLGMGIGHREPSETVKAPVTLSVSRETHRKPSPVSNVSGRKPGLGPATKLDAERDLVTYIALNGHVPNQDFLCARWGLKSKGTVSKWLADWQHAGLISRRRSGRCKVTTTA